MWSTSTSLLPNTSFHKINTKNLSIWEVSYTASAIFLNIDQAGQVGELPDVYAKCCIQCENHNTGLSWVRGLFHWTSFTRFCMAAKEKTKKELTITWDQLQGTQQEEPPQGQEGELESQEYYHLYFHCFHFCSFSSSFFLSLKLAGVVCLYSFFLLIKAINAV